MPFQLAGPDSFSLGHLFVDWNILTMKTGQFKSFPVDDGLDELTFVRIAKKDGQDL